MNRFFLWIRKRYLWILGGICAALTSALILVLRSSARQKAAVILAKRETKLAKDSSKDAYSLGEVSGKDSSLEEQQRALAETLLLSTKEIEDASKKRDLSAKDLADSFNALYHKSSDRSE